MTSKDYYYNKFTEDLKNVLKNVTLGGDGHFHVVDLFLGSKNEKDCLGCILEENLGYFLSALAATILIDQVMYTYFKEDYEKFRSMTLYPKITWSIGWCANIKPWQLFDHKIALARGLRNPEKINQFSEFMNFFITDLKEFFDKNEFEKANWEMIKVNILKDDDIVSNKYGDGDYEIIFKKQLEYLK